MLYHKTGEQGLFLGFAAWNEKEIDQAARILGLTPRQIGYALKKHDVEIKRF